MSRVFFFVAFVSAVILIFGLAQLLLLRQLNHVWWQRKWIRRASWSLPLVGVGFFILLVAGEYYQLKWLARLSSVVAPLALILEICLMFSLPVSGAIHLVGNLIDRFASGSKEPLGKRPDRHRRLFLKGAAATVPLVTLGTGLSGVGRAYGKVQVLMKDFRFDGLPPGLAGLRILHLSDMHLRHYVTLDDLEQVLGDAGPLSPELVLITGDIADDLRLLPDALNMIAGLNPRLGAFAAVGNHEHFRGIGQVRKLFSKSPIRLLIDEGVRIPSGENFIFVGGVDDPVAIRGVHPDFYRRRIDNLLPEGEASDFAIIMSHRPDVFPYTAQQGAELTLAGHTHGGQIGLWGRSLLESHFPERFLWGHYRIGRSHLYTSSGVGHWFPFRLGCPPEAPVITLRRT